MHKRRVMNLTLMTAFLICAATIGRGENPLQPISYKIGNIPDLTSRGNSPLIFQVTSNAASTSDQKFSVKAVPSLFGHYSISNSGIFEYDPDPADKQDIHLTFTIQPNQGAVGQTESQQVTVVRWIEISPEIRLVSPAQSGTPDEEGTDFLAVSVSQDPQTASWFNGVQNRQLRDIKISGKTVVFEKKHRNGLYERFDCIPVDDPNKAASQTNTDIGSVTIYAETVVIRSPLHLPGTRLVIYASKLLFEDADPKDSALIDITPTPYAKIADPRSNGNRGQNAGDIELHIDGFTYPHHKIAHTLGLSTTIADKPLFILKGGRGQDGGQGQPGSPDAPAMKDYSPQYCPPGSSLCALTAPGTVYIMKGNNAPLVGVQAWPDGGAALPGGAPGNGGSGGHLKLYASDDLKGDLLPILQSLVLADKGDTGTKPPHVEGGRPGTPAHAVWSRVGTKPFIVTEHDAQHGPGADAPDPDPKTVGSPGDLSFQTDDALTWLQPSGLEMVLAYARAAYLNNQYAAAYGALSKYPAIFDKLPASRGAQTDISRSQDQTRLLLYRLNSNLDYFGNPAGWVPMLSFQVDMQAFQNQVDSSIKLLFLTEFLRSKADQLTEKADILKATIGGLTQSINGQVATYNATQSRIPKLRQQLANIMSAQKEFDRELGEKQAELQQRALQSVIARNQAPFWQQAISILSTAAKVIPVGQPIMGTIGLGVGHLSDIKSDPMGAISGMAGITDAFSNSNIDQSEKQVDQMMTDLAGDDHDTIKQRVDKLTKVGKQWSDAYSKIAQASAQAGVPAQEVQAELQRIEAQDPEFQSLVAKVTDLGNQKAQFSQDLAQSIQTIGTLTQGITSDMKSLDTANSALDKSTAPLDHGMLVAIGDISRRAEDRLLEYHYYLAKASEYELLTPYSGDLNVQSMIGKIQSLIKTADVNWLDTPSNFQQLASVYYDELDNLAATVWGKMQTRPWRFQTAATAGTYSLTADEITQLNKNGRVTINLGNKGLIGATEENARLLTLAAVQVLAHSTQPINNGEVDFVFEHSGLSIMQSGATSFGFRHYRDDSDPPISWTSAYDLVAQGLPSQDPMAKSDVAMLRYLLGGKAPADDANMYAHAGAWADIVIRTEIKPSGIPVVIDSVKIQATYEFTRVRDTESILDVSSNVGSALISPDVPDLNGKSDGRGTFRRVYQKGSSIRLSAQEPLGNLHFKDWSDGANVLCTTPQCLIVLDSSKQVQAVYDLKGP